MAVAGAIAMIRVLAFWFLLYRRWTQTQTIGNFFFVLFLYPEALLLSDDVSWSFGWAGAFTLVLILGTCLFVCVVFFGTRLLSGKLAKFSYK